MNKFEITEIASRPKGSVVVLSEIEESLGSRRTYIAELRRMLRALAAEVSDTVLGLYEIEKQSPGILRDAEPDERWFIRLASVVATLTFRAEEMVASVLRTEANRHTKLWLGTTRRALGINLSSIVRVEDLETLLTVATARNASLIKSLGADVVRKVEQATFQAYIAGDTTPKLRRRLNEEFKILDNRAKLIAQDQMAKINADMNRIRHTQAGIEEYDWSTSKDERVRERHRRLEGKRYKYGEPTGAEGGLPPGGPIRCRCTARAVVEF